MKLTEANSVIMNLGGIFTRLKPKGRKVAKSKQQP